MATTKDRNQATLLHLREPAFTHLSNKTQVCLRQTRDFWGYFTLMSAEVRVFKWQATFQPPAHMGDVTNPGTHPHLTTAKDYRHWFLTRWDITR